MEQQQVEKEDDDESSSNDFNPCPICLGPVTQAQEAFLDRCFHKFCYNCITRWAKHVATAQNSRRPHSTLKCPSCKCDNASIVYECEAGSYRQHYINKDLEKSILFTEAHTFRLRCYYRETAAVYDKFDVQRFWKIHRYIQPNKWLQIWLKREIQALTLEEDVDVVVHHVLGLIESFMRQNQRELSQRTTEQNREYFKALVSDAARPFLIGRTARFVNELELFLCSGLSIAAYDEVYTQCLDKVTSVAVSKDEEERLHNENTQIPYLHFFDEDSDIE